jgi:hypothetical protein
MKAGTRLSIALLAALLWPGAASSQSVPEALTLRAVRVPKGPALDGSLHDPVWNQAIRFTAFKMVIPSPGAEPSEKTELRILEDGANLYIGVYCHDSEPARVCANTMTHDAEDSDEHPSDDMVRVLIDPFQEKRNSYVFMVNPCGARSEGLASGQGMSLSWDGIWDARSRLQPDGWSCEMKIPFKTISFKPGLSTWGFNVERYIPRKQETIRLSGISRDSFFTNAMEAASLEGIQGARQGLGMTFRPYGLASALQNPAAQLPTDYQWTGGFDLYKSFTPNFIGAVTYNTDFAETEVDERQINLTRFPLYFPEKRTFFLEGSEIFNFGPGGFGNFYPFFSRRIGLYEGDQVPVNFGAKVFGRLGDTNISILDMKTKSFADPSLSLNLPEQNFAAARVYQNVLAESRVGVLFTNGSPTGEKNTLAGFDLTYKTSRFLGRQNFLAGAWYLYNWNETKSGQHAGYGMRLDYPNDLWDINASYAYYGDSLNPGVGFLARNGVQNGNLGVAYQPRPEKGLIGKLVRQFFFELEFSYYWDLAGRLETRQIWTAPLNLRTESGEHIEFNIIPNRDVLPYDFEVADGVVIPKGPYDFTNYRFEFGSAPFRPWTFDLEWHFGNFYSGRYDDAEIGFGFKFKGYATFGLKANIVRGNLPQGRFNENVYELKADVFISPNLGLMNYIQYDDVSKNLGVNARLRWQISPGNEVYLVYNKNWERRWDPVSRFVPLEGRGVFKITLSIRP